MIFRTFSSLEQYLFVMRSLKESTEGRQYLPYVDLVGHATIGVGYDLTDALTRARVLHELGLSPTGATAQRYAALEAVFTQSWSGQTDLALQNAANAAYAGVVSLNDTQIDAVFADFNVRYEKVVTDWATANNLGTIPPSYERAVLVSLAYNLGTPGARLAAAIGANDRAEAWFEIRYASNEGASRSVGIAKRRFMESELFALYDDPTNVSSDEARSVYRMLQLHRAKILLEESLWGLTPEGVRGTRTDIFGRTALEAAQQDYANLLPLLSDGSVDSLTANLAPARDAILTWVNAQLPPSMAPITSGMIENAAAIYLDPGRKTSAQPVALIHDGLLVATRFDSGGNEITERGLLIGEDGGDVLIGGKGNDILLGGEGQDVYQFRSSDGSDTIFDSDGKGLLVRNTVPLVLGVGQSTQWTSGAVTYSRAANGLDLEITFAGSDDAITIKNFDFAAAGNGSLGVRLIETPAAPQNSVRTFYGDKEDWDSDGNSSNGIQPAPDGFGNSIRADGIDGRPDVPEADRADVFYGSDADEVEWFTLAGGDDSTYADGPSSATSSQGGRDFIDGGAGSDIVVAGAGDDWVEGGAGPDLLFGNAGRDVLFADSSVGQTLTIEQAIAAGETGGGLSGQGDLLSGDVDDDILIGAATADLLVGGMGADVLVGGAGDDNLLGDYAITSADRGWVAQRTVTQQGQFTLYEIAGIGVVLVDGGGVGSSDLLYGGVGNDWIFAGAGDDYLDGGEGDDVLFGHAGDDILIGGAGHDVLAGGLGKDTYIFRRGDGVETIFDTPQGVNDPDASIVILGAGIDPALVKFRPGSLFIDVGEAEGIHIEGFDQVDPFSTPVLGALIFADGTTMSFLEVLERGFDIDGTEGNDIIVGTGVTDRVLGFGGDDELLGLAGDDLLDGGTGNDRLFGQAGNDSFLGDDGADSLVGDAGDDTLSGGAGRDALWGGEGNDLLDGGADADVLIGGAGDDAYVFGPGDQVFDYFGATRVVFGAGITAGDLSLRRQLINGSPVYSVGLNSAVLDSDKMFISVGADTQLASFEFADGTLLDHQALLRETWVDGALVVGTAGADTLDGYAGGDLLQGGDGDDVLRGHRGADRLEGGNGADTLEGGSGADLLLGGAGADTLDGGTGDDQLVGGDGDDLYVIDAAAGSDSVSEGTVGDFDTVQFSVTRAEATLTRVASGDLRIRLDDGTETTILGQYNGSAYQVERLVFTDTTVEAAELDALTVAPISGTAGNDVLVGTAFADTLQGLAGDDTLDGGGGDDQLEGGAGTDTYRLRFNGGTDQIFEDGVDQSVIQLDPGIAFENLVASRSGDDLVLRLQIGGASLALPGYYQGQTNWVVRTDAGGQMTAADLVDYLETITPPDTPEEFEQQYIDTARQQYLAYLASFGASGDIQINVQAPSDAATIFKNAPYYESGGGGTFHLNIGDITGGPSANVLDFRASGPAIADAGAGDDLINNQGAGFNNTSPFVSIGSILNGGLGNDSILGTWSADILLGGPGNDYLAGSEGNDTYVVFAGDSGTVIVDEVINDVDLGGGHTAFAGASDGADTLEMVGINYADVDFTVGSYNGPSTVYTTLDMTWGTGQTVRLLLPDWDNPQAYGVETVRFADGTLVEQFRLRNYVMPATTGIAGSDATINGTAGDDTLSAFDGVRTTLNGLAGDDRILGGNQNDVLRGGDGNDWQVDGFGGDDIIEGGPGTDTVRGGSGNDVFLFGLGSGLDEIIEFDDLDIYTDTLRMGAGIDPGAVGVTELQGHLYVTLPGTSDRAKLHNAVSEEFPGYGVDRVEFDGGTVWTRAELRARAGVLAPTSGDDLTGGTQAADEISGLAGNDQIDGLGGDDTLLGDEGNDELYGSDGDDLLYGGAGDDYVEGDVGNDVLIGGDGIDDLEDWAGQNFIHAGAGDDYVFVYGEGETTFVIGGPGADWIDVFSPDHVLAYNRGDGEDTAFVLGSFALSLGGGIAAGDLTLEADGDDRILRTGGTDSIRLSPGGAWPALRLQVVGSDVRVYDLRSLIEYYDVQAASQPGLVLQLDPVLASHQIAASATQAYGGDLAYLYAKGQLDDTVSRDAVLPVVTDPNFGVALQTISHPDAPPVSGGTGSEVLSGTSGNEVLSGADGNDWLDAGSGDDTLVGGTGDDLLFGGAGADTYVYNLGDGVDTVVDPSGPDGSNTVQFGEGIASQDLTLGLGSLLVRVGTSGGIHFESFDPQNPFGARDVDRFEFFDSTVLTYEQLLALGFDLEGTDGADQITGTATVDRIRGGLGDDVLAGGLGSDTYLYDTGDGADTIQEGTDPSSTDVLRFGAGIASAGLAVSREVDDIVIDLPTAGDQVRLSGWFTVAGGTVERVEFDDGSFWTAAELESQIQSGNQPPVLANPIADQQATEDSAFSFAVPADAFADPDPGDTLTYTASLADGLPLPLWLSFNPQTRTFAGTPANDDVGTLSVQMTATDGSNESASDVFDLSVANTNDAPIVANPVADQSAIEDESFGFTVPANAFADVDPGDTLTYSASLADGSILPSWLAFDAPTRTFSGTPANDDIGTLSLKVTVTDGSSAPVFDVFDLVVANSNDAPTVANPISDQYTTEGIALSYVIPADTFQDVDVGDALLYTAGQTDGSTLPGWLAFDPQTRTFSGMPTNTAAGLYNIRVTATDMNGANTFDDFLLDVANLMNGTPGSDLLTGSALRDVIFGFDGNDRLVGQAGDDVIDGGAGDDIIYGDNGNDSLSGGDGLDQLQGGAGDDWLDGGAPAGTNDYLSGGEGNDTFVVYSDPLVDSHVEVADVGATLESSGYDTVLFAANLLPADIVLRRVTLNDLGIARADAFPGQVFAIVYGYFDDDLRYRIEELRFLSDGTVLDRATIETIVATPTSGPDILHGTAGNDSMDGLGGNDQVWGYAGNDVLNGGPGDDVMHGYDGDDVLNGGTGNDIMEGGLGNDVFVFELGSGTDVIQNGEETPGDLDFLQFGAGISPSNVTVSKAEQNRLQIAVDGTSDVVLVSNYFYAPPYTIEEIRFADGTVWTEATISSLLPIEGTAGNEWLQGTGIGDLIYGLGGNDNLNGAGGDDLLDGGSGADTMSGGPGNDHYVVDSTSDQVIENPGEGIDTISTDLSWTLGANFENLTLTGSSNRTGTGNELDNTIIGNSGRNTLTGGPGNDWLDGGSNRDTLVGGTGDDTYVVDHGSDSITENANEGIDTVRSTLAWTLDSNLENLTLLGTTNINGTGNTLANVLTGNAGNNTLTGNAGNDTLDGQAGADTLVGGTGNDTYLLGRGHGAELVEENDTTAGNTDIGQFLENIAPDQIWFRQSGSNLEVSIIGTPDQLTVQNWYSGSQYRLEQFRTEDGQALMEAQVQNLVDAMAAFSPPPPGQETLPPEYATQLNPVIAANWQ